MPSIVYSNLAQAGAQRKVRIDLPGREYEILIGAGMLNDAGRFIAQRLGPAVAALSVMRMLPGITSRRWKRH